MEGTYIKSLGDDAGALRAFEKALEIGYTSRGGSVFEYLIDLWRVVGASMACKNRDRAYDSLSKIWNARDFKSLPPSEAKAAFIDLTLHYSMPWWKDQQDYGRQARMEDLIKDVICSNEGKAKRKSKKGKGKKKK